MKMILRRSLLCVAALVWTEILSGAEIPLRDLPRGDASLWNVKALDAAPRTYAVDLPCSNEYGRVAGVEPIWIEGEPYRGKPTRVFAWWGLPKGASAAAKAPAMVLVHGGGGTAFARWVKTWNDRGYAAIAMDTCGKIPQGERDGQPHNTHAWSGPSGWGSSVAQVDEPVTDQWTYHAVAAVMRCHSFLRARPEVDANHIGLTGISWGGYLTSIIMSVDDRFMFAAPVYGCGWYDLNPQWSNMGTPEAYRKWLARWDPKNFIQGVGNGWAKRPVLWCCGTNDRWYPLDAVRRSYGLVDPAVPLTLSLKLRMPHGHGAAGDPKEITAMAERYLRGGRPLVEIKDAWLRDGKLNVIFDAHGRTVAKAELLATCGTDPVLEKRPWTATPVVGFDAARGSFAAPVPEQATLFFANVVTDDGLVVSTRVFERQDWGLAANPHNSATDWMPGKVGLFAHYLYGGDLAGRVAAEFDVPGLVQQILDAKADCFCLTLGQNTGWMCAPNATYEKTVGYAAGTRCCPRDIPGEIAAALKPHGVKFLLYLPCQPPNNDARAEGAFGFPAEGKGDRTINRDGARAWAKVIEEWSRRYGDGVAGWWFDGGYRWCRFDDEIAEIYAAACKRGNPHAVVAFNEGVRKPVRRWTEAGDYLAGEVNEPLDEVCAGRFLDGRQWHVLTYCGKTWGRPDCRFSDDQWVNWLKPVLAKGGAVTIDVNIDRPTGRLCPEQVAQLKRVFARARGDVTGTARPDLVAKVEAGELKEARASWWGFDAVDATKALQAAIDSRVPRLIVDRMEGPWYVLPLRGVSNQELVFEQGAEVCAKRGEYKSKGACLFTFRGCENIVLSGYGATLRMWHEDYMKPPYEKSEWRHLLSVLSCRNVRIEGLTVASSGGDGIYIGSSEQKLRKCVDVVIRDVLCHDNHRQGISIITAENLLIENTVMRETHGTPPAAGIDFEPNHPQETLKNCVMRNCLTVNNEGHGYTTWAGQLNESSAPIDIRFENCTSIGDRSAFGFAVDSHRGRDVAGKLTIRNCRFEKPRGPLAVNIRENRFGTLAFDITGSTIVTTNAAGAEVVTAMGEAWRKANLPHQFDPDFAIPHVMNPDFAHTRVVDDAPGQLVKLQPMRVRHAAVYRVWADAARTLRFTGHQCRVGRYKPATKPIVVTGPDGTVVAKIPLPLDFNEGSFSFAAPAAGFYTLTFDLGLVAFQMTAADAPVALDVTDQAQGLIASAGTMWVSVPAGTKKFALFVCGEGVERVNVALASPQGGEAWRQADISNWAKAVVSAPAQGIWKITASKPTNGCFEDARYDIAGVPGFLFLSDRKYWAW